jgi:hypothetical protein
MQGKRPLFKMVAALHPPTGFAGSLHGWQKQRNQHADDRNDDEEFDKGEPTDRSTFG